MKREYAYVWVCAAVAGLLFFSAGSAAGTTRTWIGGTNGSWYLGTNWDPTGSPDPADALTVNSGSGDSGAGAIAIRGGGSLTVLNPGVSVTTPQFWIADWGAGSLSIRNGALLSSWDTLICGFAGTTGTAEVTDGGSLLETYSLTIGASGTGTLTLSGGGRTTSQGSVYLGTNAGATGILSLSGWGSRLTVGQGLYVGSAGSGTVEVHSGADVSSTLGTTVAHMTGSFGTLAVDGPLAVFKDLQYLIIGNQGQGALIVQNGGTVTTGSLSLGYTGLGAGQARVEGMGSLLDVAVLDVGRTDASAGTLDILGCGEVRVGGATAVRAQGVINLSGGTLKTATLSGSGRVNFSGGTLQVTAGGLTFGYNQPVGPAVTLNAGDLIDVSAAATLDLGAGVVVAGGRLRADTVTNYASLDVRPGGSVIAYNQVYNAAVLYLDNGSISAPSGIVNDYGATLIARGAVAGPLTSFGQTFVTGTLSVSGAVTSFGSILATNRSDTPLLRCGSLDNYGLIDLAGRYWSGQEWVTVPGAVTTFMPTAAVANYAGGAIRGCSSIGGRLTNSGGLIYADLPGTLLIRELTANVLGGELRIADGSSMNILTAFQNQGEINLEGPNSALSGSSIANTGTLHGQGRVYNPVANTGDILAEGGILRLAGAVTNGAGGLVEAMNGATVFASQGIAVNDGHIVLRGGTLDNNARVLSNSGDITGCGTLRTGGLTNNPGGTVGVGGGNLEVIGWVCNDGAVNTQAGAITTFYNAVNGTGSFPGSGTVIFLDSFSPGHSPAEVAFGGDVTLAPSAALEMELGGLAPGVQYDKLDVGGTLGLGGTLDVALIYGFLPRAGQAFDLLDWSSLSGTFDAVDLPELGGGLGWDTSNLYTDGSLTVVPEPATLALVGLGGLVLAARRWGRRETPAHGARVDQIVD